MNKTTGTTFTMDFTCTEDAVSFLRRHRFDFISTHKCYPDLTHHVTITHNGAEVYLPNQP